TVEGLAEKQCTQQPYLSRRRPSEFGEWNIFINGPPARATHYAEDEIRIGVEEAVITDECPPGVTSTHRVEHHYALTRC
ncbi:hypothetical protein, partial [Enterobacter hormaechei]|uniref:hypothetical protein n=1 Tax=Enterobacter hormaechei TaxID=158836 RepID=UPI00203B4E32